MEKRIKFTNTVTFNAYITLETMGDMISKNLKIDNIVNVDPFIKFGNKTYNNAICEGINNKIKAIKRSPFGILNFSHLRARVFLSFRNMTPEKNEDF